jgi:MFS family permease
MFLYGLSAVLIGPALPGIIQTYGLSLSSGGLISALQNAGGIAGAALAILFADRVRRPLGVVVSFSLLGMVWALIGIRMPLVQLMILFAASGLLIRTLDVFLNAHTGAVVGSSSGRPMNVLHMFFSVGAFLGPILARSAMSAGVSWQVVYLGTGLLYLGLLLPAAPRLRRYLETTGTSGRHTVATRPARLTGRPARGILLLATALFFYSIHQGGISTWVPYFFEFSGRSSAYVASVALSIYWLGIIAGRFTASRVVDRVGHRALLVYGGVISGAATVGAVLVQGAVSGIVLLFVAGLMSGATIPLAYSLGYGIAPGRTGALTAVMSLVMLGGRFLGPWLVGIVADSSSIGTAMLIPAVSVGVTGLLVLPLARHRQVRDAAP